ncbi:MAG: hypothetical protein LIO94_08770 [Clostridiales bacterium]|nr:hypothetical protein [Clostridiales bacterium]
MDRESLRKGLYAVAGLYLLYTAWQLFKDMDNMEMNPTVIVIFIIFFTVAGGVLVGNAVWSMYKGAARKDSSTDAAEESDTNAAVEADSEPEAIAEAQTDPSVNPSVEKEDSADDDLTQSDDDPTE